MKKKRVRKRAEVQSKIGNMLSQQKLGDDKYKYAVRKLFQPIQQHVTDATKELDEESQSPTNQSKWRMKFYSKKPIQQIRRLRERRMC